MASDFAFSNSITHVKGVAILLVVLGHISSPFGTAIFSFHIPLFFFLGGIFTKTTYSVADFMKRNFVRLIVPYFIFGAFGLMVNDIKNVLLNRPQEDLFPSLTGLLFWMDAPHLQHYGFVLWFLPALFWARVFSFCLMKYLKQNEWLIFVLCVMCAYLCSSRISFTLPFAIDKGLVALPWVFMGTVFYRHREKLLTMSVWNAVFVALLVLLMIFFGGMQRLDMATRDVGHMFVSLPYTFSIIFLIIYLAYKANCGNKNLLAPLSWFGHQSMLVYIVHPYTNNGADLLTTHFLGVGYWYITFVLTAAMLMVVIRVKLNHQDLPLFKYL
jgi:fucose 4-O-acetylase-like acetyltransferase